jgi:hypothetical protein
MAQRFPVAQRVPEHDDRDRHHEDVKIRLDTGTRTRQTLHPKDSANDYAQKRQEQIRARAADREPTPQPVGDFAQLLPSLDPVGQTRYDSGGATMNRERP